MKSEQILTLMADGKPRSTPEIAQELVVPSDEISSRVAWLWKSNKLLATH